MKRIEIPHVLTSYSFFTDVLPKVVHSSDTEIFLDMSNTRRIEPLVIPNLLCLAYRFKFSTHNKLILSIPDTMFGGSLRHYLNEIDFTEYAKKYGLFDFPYDPYGGLEGKKIDPLCGTLIFNADDDEDTIKRSIDNYIGPFSVEYLSKFQKYNSENSQYENEITEFLREIVLNSKIHAKSFSIATLHANYAAQTIYIAVSDIGCGFLSSLNNPSIHTEKEAILKGVYKRRQSKTYGLYSVIRRILEYNGRVRIHSNDTQIIITPRVMESFLNESLESLSSFQEYNVKNSAFYSGVHIEMEIPLEMRDVHVNNKN